MNQKVERKIRTRNARTRKKQENELQSSENPHLEELELPARVELEHLG
jgi:hypothetical protein